MAEEPTDRESPAPTSAYGSQQAEWLTYREAGERLGIDPAAVAARAPDIADAVRAAMGPLSEALAREAAERRALQVEADGLRDRLAAAQLAMARASGETNVERVKREAAEAKAIDLQGRLDLVLGQFDKLRAETSKPRRRWWQRS
jgi:predicted RNA methylase